MIKKTLTFLALIVAGISSYHGYRYYKRCTVWPVRYPFIGSNGYRKISNHFFDQSEKVKILMFGKTFNPEIVKNGDVIFIKNCHFYMKRFFRDIHPKIKAHYVLVSSDGDVSIPGVYATYLSDENLVAWCGHNVSDLSSPKMIPLPIGVMGILNKRLPQNAQEIWGEILIDIKNNVIQKKHLVYNNISANTNRTIRQPIIDIFDRKYFCKKTARLPYEQFLRNMATYKFVISPHGTGLDCYRTWEALMLGCIPIVKRSVLDVLYEDLPVLIIDSWEEITEELLQSVWNDMSQKKFMYEKLHINYWISIIRKQAEKARKEH